MTPKRRRLALALVALVMLACAAALMLRALERNIVFFVTPSELAAENSRFGQRVRVGGLVEEGSILRSADSPGAAFFVTDGGARVGVRYSGILPDLFREGQGVVVEGVLGMDGVFVADRVLAKHDETYMPPEVAEALKRAGQWRGAGSAP